MRTHFLQPACRAAGLLKLVIFKALVSIHSWAICTARARLYKGGIP